MRIYLLTNTVNGKVYVGQTRATLPRRWKGHLHDARQGNTRHLYQAIRKYGESAFTIRDICPAVSFAELNLLERIFIRLYGSHDSAVGYNKTFGGDGVWATEESRRRNSEAVKAKWNDPEYRRKSSEGKRGIIPSEDTRRKMSDAHRGKKHAAASRAKISAVASNRSEEVRRRMSEAIKAAYARRKAAQ